MQDTRPLQTPSSAPTPGPSPVLPPPPKRASADRRETIKSILTTIGILLIAPILALAITAYVFQSYEVDGPSMEPTLKTSDRLIVWKTGRTWARITGKEYIPPRGTIVIFIKRGLYDFNSNREKQLIKRIVGLPGDRVVVKDGVMRVYNSEKPEGFDPDELIPDDQGVTGEITGSVDITVEPGNIFVVGDHRDNSLDSRSFGAVPAEDIVGTLSARILPLKDAEKF